MLQPVAVHAATALLNARGTLLGSCRAAAASNSRRTCVRRSR
jgi:hypothetical protein